MPELLPVLRVLADRRPLPARFLLLGSASPDLVRGASESLAGRVRFMEMGGFNLSEVGVGALRRLWARGGLPRSFLARNDSVSLGWREDFVSTFLERDLRRFGEEVPPEALRRLWSMIAHYHGQIWNASEVGRSLGEAHTTVRRHLDVLTGALVVRQLPPWFENIGKRQVKSPKVFVRDTGLLHALLGLSKLCRARGQPKARRVLGGLRDRRGRTRGGLEKRTSGPRSRRGAGPAGRERRTPLGNRGANMPMRPVRRNRCISRSPISGWTGSGWCTRGQPVTRSPRRSRQSGSASCVACSKPRESGERGADRDAD